MSDVAATPILTPESALEIFREMLRQLPEGTGYPATVYGLSMQDVRWEIAECETPLILDVRISVSARIIFVALNCRWRNSRVRRSEGRWEYLLKPAIFDGEPLLVRAPHSMYRNLEDLRSDLEADVTMYNDGTYATSQERPRSPAGMPDNI
jgi:hypothetical protein